MQVKAPVLTLNDCVCPVLLLFCVCASVTQLPAGSVDVELLHDATRREARAAA